MGIAAVFLIFFSWAAAATAQQAGSCLQNGRTCQWDTSLGNCCSTYCYQQVGQATGVCQDRPGTAGAGAATAYQTPQRNPATYSQNGIGIYGGGQAAAGGQCIQNGQSCQWDTSMGNCCSTYCYQQQGQSTGVCQDRPGGSQTAGQGTYQATPQYSAPAYSQPVQPAASGSYAYPAAQTACTGCYSGTPQASQPAYSGYSGQAAGNTGSTGCLATGQTCTWSGSMGNCCSGWCQQLEPQPTGVCAQPAGTPGPTGSYSSQTLQRNPSNVAPSPISYSTPGQVAGQGGNCIANGQTCQWDTSMGNCCSTYCYQQQGQSTGVCQDRPGGSQTAGQGTYQGTPQYSAPAYSQPVQPAASGPAQTACPGCYSGTPQASQPAYSGYSGQAAGNTGSTGCLATGQQCTWSGTMGNCCSGWCRQMENESTGTCSEKIYSQG